MLYNSLLLLTIELINFNLWIQFFLSFFSSLLFYFRPCLKYFPDEYIHYYFNYSTLYLEKKQKKNLKILNPNKRSNDNIDVTYFIMYIFIIEIKDKNYCFDKIYQIKKIINIKFLIFNLIKGSLYFLYFSSFNLNYSIYKLKKSFHTFYAFLSRSQEYEKT